MKFITILFLFSIYSCLNKKEDNYNFVLIGKFEQKFDNQYVYINRIIDVNNGVFFIKDSSIIKNNKFIIKGKLNHPSELVNISIKDYPQSGYSFVMDKGINHIYIPKAEDENLFINIVVPKSESNEIQKEYFELRKSYLNKYFVLFDDITNEGKKIKDLSKEGVEKVNTDFLKQLKAHPNCFYSLYSLNLLLHTPTFQDHPNELMETYNILNQNIQNSELGKEFFQEVSHIINVNEKTSAGNLFMDFEILDEKNKLFSTKSIKGKPFIVAFSGTWCSYCLEYEPTLLNYYHQFKSQDLKVVYINSDDNVEKWLKHIKEKKLDWINVSERKNLRNCEIDKLYNINAYPTYIIVNKKGVIIYNSNLSNDLENLEYFINKVVNDK